MKEPHIPANENDRLAELYDFDILDTETEKEFDEIVQLASLICESPISLVSLIDRDRQWFKARKGLEDHETARNVALCAHAINQDGLMEIPDAMLDERFVDNPLVTGFPNIRFYAGVPLVTSSGNKMGTLCVIDNKPRQLRPDQRFALETLAKQVTRQMEFRRLTTKLRASNERNSIFVQQAPNALAMFDREMCYMAASQKWRDDYHLQDRDIIGISHYDIFPEISDDWKDIHKACLAGAINRCAEAHFIRADGSEQWITWDVRPWYVSDGKIGGLLMYTADISAMKNKDAENDRISRILDKTNEVARIGTWEVNCQANELTWSRITREIHEVDENFSPDVATAIHFYKEGASRDALLHHHEQAQNFGVPYDLELCLITAKGNEVWVRSIAQTEFDHGICKRIYGVFHDITERKKAELATIDARNLAEQSSRLKETFLANMSHEIRTPMNAIIGFTDLLLKKELGTEALEYIRIVKHSGENLLRIINDILDISKINSGMMSFETHPLSIDDLFHSLTAMLQRTADEKKLKLNFEVSPDLPARVMGDPTRLTQILINLTGNAIKFTDRGSVTVFAKLLREDKQSYYIEISVSDTGIGIASEKLQHIFERFGQAECNTTRRYGGTGLGLSIARQLVELQGGTININSTKDSGTVVTFTLPFTKVSNSTAQKNTPLPGKVMNIATLGQLHLLLVDDNPINLKLLIGMFSGLNVTVSTAANGRKALELLETTPVDVVLLDMEMPEMNGYETVAYLRHHLHSQVPVIAMTANAMAGEREKCLRIGMNDYIPKPIKAEELFEKIALVVSGHQEAEKIINLDFLRASMGEQTELILEVLDLFIELVPADVKAISSAISDANFPVIKKRTHKLLSSVMALGASRMEIILKEMESLAERKSGLGRIRDLEQQLHRLYETAVEEVKFEKNLLVKNHA